MGSMTKRVSIVSTQSWLERDDSSRIKFLRILNFSFKDFGVAVSIPESVMTVVVASPPDASVMFFFLTCL